MVRDAFPLPWVDEVLQAVNNCQWFIAFDLARGYLRCQWQNQIYVRSFSELGHLAYMNLHTCHLDYPTLALVS